MKNGRYPKTVELVPIAKLRPHERHARTHSKAQLRQIVRSFEAFGMNNPILIDDDDNIIAGHGRWLAAKELGWGEMPALRASHMSKTQIRAYVIADNKLALNSGWDQQMLAIEFQALIELNVDVTITGFSTTEVDLTLDFARNSDPELEATPEDHIPPLEETAVTQAGDLWLMGRHKLLAGDAREASAYTSLLGGEAADMIFTDPPYNVRIDQNVTGRGRYRHHEFAMASGEMSSDVFAQFLSDTLMNSARVCRDGAIAYVCMDWRHIGELVAAGKTAFSELKNVCVWNKSNGGMGTFYRSKHELIFVFKVGSAPHINNFGLGETGRPRSNVWDYPGISSIGPHRAEALRDHPTVKPVALVADAMRDCSRRGDTILDAFAGSGTTLIAAETCGRRARVIELNPRYCDVILRRYQQLTGKPGILAGTNFSFEDISEQRVGGHHERKSES